MHRTMGGKRLMVFDFGHKTTIFFFNIIKLVQSRVGQCTRSATIVNAQNCQKVVSDNSVLRLV